MLRKLKSEAAGGFINKIKEFSESKAGIYLRGSVPISLLVIFLCAVSMISFSSISCACAKQSSIHFEDEGTKKMNQPHVAKEQVKESLDEKSYTVVSPIDKKLKELEASGKSYQECKKELIDYLKGLPNVQAVKEGKRSIWIIFSNGTESSIITNSFGVRLCESSSHVTGDATKRNFENADKEFITISESKRTALKAASDEEISSTIREIRNKIEELDRVNIQREECISKLVDYIKTLPAVEEVNVEKYVIGVDFYGGEFYIIMLEDFGIKHFCRN